MGLEAKLIVAMLISRYEVHADSGKPDPFDPKSFAGVRLTVTNRGGVREAVMGASLRQLERRLVGDKKKFVFF